MGFATWIFFLSFFFSFFFSFRSSRYRVEKHFHANKSDRDDEAKIKIKKHTRENGRFKSIYNTVPAVKRPNKSYRFSLSRKINSVIATKTAQHRPKLRLKEVCRGNIIENNRTRTIVTWVALLQVIPKIIQRVIQITRLRLEPPKHIYMPR